MVGQTISHYKITDKLGEGGMGVVYKAEDLKLGRAVALKFLPSHLLESAEHKARFLHEAKAAALLDHPNICTVYEIDEADGQTFLAMACLGGQTLKQKIAQRPLPLQEALDIAVQIGQGLQAAHEKGIVHRDIKPANIMITPQSQVKIMDFGLAQLSDRTKLTATGSKLGTPAYMPPEQTEGKPADRRSDIWSLGVVLCEMISGRVPFPGEAEAAVAYAIVYTEPEPLTALRSGLPVELDRVTAKALAKNPGERYQHVDELMVDLQDLRKYLAGKSPKGPPAPESGLVQPLGQVQTSTPSLPPTSLSRLRVTWAIAGALVGAALVASLTFLNLQEPPPLEPVRFTLGPPAGEGGLNLAVSPDGRRVAFVARGESGSRLVWLRDLAAASAQPLQGTEGARQLFWSPDGRYVAFFADAKLKKVAASGGPPEILGAARGETSSRGGAWSPSGEIVAGLASPEGLFRLPATGGEPRPVTQLDTSRGENSHRWPHFLPDGRRFLYTARSSQAGNTTVYAGSLDSSEVQRILSVPSNAAYAPSRDGKAGHLLYTRAGALLAQRFDAETLQLMGEARLVVEGVLHRPGSAESSFSVSADGRVLAFLTGGAEYSLTWFGRAGEPFGSVGQSEAWDSVQMSPDGRRVAVVKTDIESGIRDIWTIDLASGIPSRVTSGTANAHFQSWSPDGRRIAYSADPEGVLDIYVIGLGAAGKPEPVLKSRQAKGQLQWSPDGRAIAYVSRNDIWMLPLFGDRKPIPVVQSGFGEDGFSFSPDGRWLAYRSNESGQPEIHVRPLPSDLSQTRPERGVRVSIGGASNPRWRRDAKELFYLDRDNVLTAVDVLEGQTFQTSQPRRLFETCANAYNTPPFYDVTADGQRFLIGCPAEEGTGQIQVWVNWAEAIER